MKGTLAVTGDPDADRLVNTDPFALLLAMMLDQQIPMEFAFASPNRLAERMGGRLDAATLAATPIDDVVAMFSEPRALHRFPKSMAERAHRLAAHVVEHYDGDAAALWDGADTGAELHRRLRELPGYGDEKTKIFVAILAKRLGVRPPGWEEAAGPFADDTPRSVADIDSPEALDQVRAWKKAQKAAKKSKQD